MTGRRKSAARRKAHFAGLLFAVYMISMLMGQVCMTAYALDETPANAGTTTAAVQETKTGTEEEKNDADPEKPEIELEEKEYEPVAMCGIPEHTHSAACYDRDGYLICGLEEHQHVKECYTACGIEAHKHNADCYDVDGKLICEKVEHEHDKVYCYPICNKPEHVHTAACLNEDGELVCGLERHIHGPECCPVKPDPKDQETEPAGEDEEARKEEEASKTKGHPNWLPAQCGIPEHTHTAACRDENGAYICGLIEHSHGRDCYLPKETEPKETEPQETEPKETEAAPGTEEPKPEETKPEDPETQEPEIPGETTEDPKIQEKPVYCGKEEHAHSESCEDAEGNIICGKELHQHDESCHVNPEETQPQEKTLYCGKEEHTHGDECYDENGDLICTLEEHTHDDSCYGNPEEDKPVTNCGFEEHVHTDACYDENHENIICGKAEHTHTDECYRPVYCGHVAHKHSALCLDAEGNLACNMEEHTHEESCFVEVPEGMMLTCGKTAHTHTDACKDENGEYTCGLEEHQHTEDCFSPILEGEVYYPVTDTADLDPDTAYLILAQLGEDKALYMAMDGEAIPAAPVATVDGVDAEGKPCVSLALAEENLMALEEEAPAEEAETSAEEAAETSDGETEDPNLNLEAPAVDAAAEPVAALGNALLWQPTQDDPATLTNVEDLESVFSLNAQPEVATFDLAEEEAPKTEIVFLAYGMARSGTECPENPCPIDIWTQWDDPNDITDDITAMNPFGDAHNYTLFVLGNCNNIDVVHGSAAIKGNVTGTNQGVGREIGSLDDYSGNKTVVNPVALLLGGSTDTRATKIEATNGSVICSQTAKDANGLSVYYAYKGVDHFHIVDQNTLDTYFENAEDALIAENAYITEKFNSADAEHTGKYDFLTQAEADAGIYPGVAGADVVLKGTSHEYNVFNLPSSFLTAKGASGESQRAIMLDVPFGSYTVINVIDEDRKVDNFGPELWYKDSNGKWTHQPANKEQNDNYKQTQRTLMNFSSNITEVTVQGNAYVYASVYGPQVDLKIPGTGNVTFQGNSIFKSVEGNSKVQFLKNDFEVSGAATFNKYTKCRACEEGTGCLIHNSNKENGGNGNWDDYRVDVTLESIDHVGGEPRVFELNGMKLDGTIFGNGSKARTLYLAPGDYLVTKERIYRVNSETGEEIAKVGADGLPVYRVDDGIEKPDGSITDAYGNFLESNITFMDGSTFTKMNVSHLLSGAYFTRIQHLPTDKELEGIAVPDKKILNIEPYVEELETIVNVYGNEITDEVIAVKRWVEYVTDAYGIVHEVMTDGPENGFAAFELWSERKDSDGNWSGELVQVEDMIKRATEETNWYVVWNLPKDPDVRYFVKESGCSGGFIEVTNPDPNVEWYNNTDSQYSPFFNTARDMWVIKNEKVDCYTLTVDKKWEGLSEGEVPPEIKVQLYRLAAAAAPSAEDIIKNGTPFDPEEPGSGKVILSQENNWTHTWEGLPKKIGTQNYYYGVKEIPVDGFTPSYGNPVINGDTITQTVTNKPTPPEPGKITVRKQWQDEDGNPIEPGEDYSATMQLYQQKGTSKPASGGATANVIIELKDKDGTLIKSEALSVNSGSTVNYSAIFAQQDSDWSYKYATTSFEGATVEKLNGFTGTGQPGLGWQTYVQIKVWGSIEVTGDTTLTIQSTLANNVVYQGEDVEINGITVSAPVFVLQEVTAQGPVEWDDWAPYGDPVVLKDPWLYTWENLPVEVKNEDGSTSLYRYYVKEIACTPAPEGTSYTFNGTAVEDPESLTDFTGGTVVVTNRVSPFQGGPELPKAGGSGTHLYTLGGLLLSAAAGALLMYKLGKRRKEDFASF